MTQPRKPPSAAERLSQSLTWSFDNMLQIARAYLEDPEQGDVPTELVYQFGMRLSFDESKRLLERIDILREQHFSALGVPVPIRKSSGRTLR